MIAVPASIAKVRGMNSITAMVPESPGMAPKIAYDISAD